MSVCECVVRERSGGVDEYGSKRGLRMAVARRPAVVAGL